jgi:hypothetical protein
MQAISAADHHERLAGEILATIQRALGVARNSLPFILNRAK